jgi:hypothetical protein
MLPWPLIAALSLELLRPMPCWDVGTTLPLLRPSVAIPPLPTASTPDSLDARIAALLTDSWEIVIDLVTMNPV